MYVDVDVYIGVVVVFGKLCIICCGKVVWSWYDGGGIFFFWECCCFFWFFMEDGEVLKRDRLFLVFLFCVLVEFCEVKVFLLVIVFMERELILDLCNFFEVILEEMVWMFFVEWGCLKI